MNPSISLWDELNDDIWSIKERETCYFNTGLTKDNIDEYVRNVAAQFIVLTKLDLPGNFFTLCVCQKCEYIGEYSLEKVNFPWLPKWLNKIIYKNKPTHRAVCSMCGEPFPINMGDYVARKQYLIKQG
jgi:hypothetical protein